tara:strand:- start:1076 stop:1279 length:204 start_codon:yes stop_codon:yes gene_type:complete
MNKWTEILLGLILIVGTFLVGWYSSSWWGEFWNFRGAAWIVLKGGLAWFVFFLGLLFLMLGISDLKN